VPGDTSQSNQVTMMLIQMATHISDPRKRLKAIVASSTKAKTLTGSMKSIIPTDMPSLGIPWLMSVVTPLYKTAISTNRIPVVANLVISNVPGPQMPLYLAGGKMVSYFPVSIVTHGLALNITIQSYNGSLDYGLIACKKTVPDLDKFAKAMRAAHAELWELVQADAVVSKVAPVKPARSANKTKVAAAMAKAPKLEKKKPPVKKTTAKQATKKPATGKKPSATAGIAGRRKTRA
jgi:hypothetical protein